VDIGHRETEAYAQILGAIFWLSGRLVTSEVLQKKAEAVQGNRKTILGNLRTTKPLILDVVKGAMAILVAFGWRVRSMTAQRARTLVKNSRYGLRQALPPF
jgi:hypothetical protein